MFAEATRRGLGAALLRRPAKLAKLVAGIAAEAPLPLTVKVRTGEKEDKINVQEVVALLGEAGAAAVIVHGRTMEQRWDAGGIMRGGSTAVADAGEGPSAPCVAEPVASCECGDWTNVVCTACVVCVRAWPCCMQALWAMRIKIPLREFLGERYQYTSPNLMPCRVLPVGSWLVGAVG
jgi:hypothetical protein